MNVRDYIAYETERQSGTMAEAVGMYQAWMACQVLSEDGSMPVEQNIKGLCYLIDRVDGYRNTPVYFRSGGHAANHISIPRLMSSLFGAIGSQSEGLQGRENWLESADYWTKEFLEIHPFADGNGRVGSLLWNWLRGTLNNPEPMPNFFGEQ